MKKVFCTIDIGGTKILLLLVDHNRTVLYREKSATPAGVSPGELVSLIGDAAGRALNDTGLPQGALSGFGACVAGLIGYPDGVIYQSPNIGWHEPVPFLDLLQKKFDCPVYLENDANAAVLGEVHYGAAQGHRDAIYVTVSTGIGGGLYLDGRLYRGSTGFAGEVGHMKPFGKGKRCSCGGDDCLEAWAGGSSISACARTLWDEKTLPDQTIDTKWVFQQACEGDPLAQNIVQQAISDIGKGLANLLAVLNPTCLVIGGGMTGGSTDFLDQIRAAVTSAAIGPAIEMTPLEILPAALEPEAGVWGMFALMNL